MSTETAVDRGEDEEEISLLQVAQDPELLRERVEGAEAPGIESTRELTGDERNHSMGENLRRAFGYTRWGNVLERLERADHPAMEEASHQIVEHPRAYLDHLIHVDDMDKLRLEYDELEGLRKERRATFEWLQEHPEMQRQDAATVKQIKQALTQSAEKVWGGNGHHDRYGYGLVNAQAAMERLG
jgi:hypothetical protein